MWNLIKTEMTYNRNTFLMFVLLLFLLVFLLGDSAGLEGVKYFLLTAVWFFLSYSFIGILNERMNRENRQFFYALLPFSKRQVARVRILILVIIPLITAIIIFTGSIQYTNISFKTLYVIFGLTSLFCLIILVQRDLYLASAGMFGKAAHGLVYLLLWFFVCAVLFFGLPLYLHTLNMDFSQLGSLVVKNGNIFEYLFTVYGYAAIFILNWCFGFLSLESFARRKDFQTF